MPIDKERKWPIGRLNLGTVVEFEDRGKGVVGKKKIAQTYTGKGIFTIVLNEEEMVGVVELSTGEDISGVGNGSLSYYPVDTKVRISKDSLIVSDKNK